MYGTGRVKCQGKRLISPLAQDYDGRKIISLFSSEKLKGQTQKSDILPWESFEFMKCEVFYFDLMSSFISIVGILVAHWKMT